MGDLKRYKHGARNGVMTPDPEGPFVRYEEAAAALEAAREDGERLDWLAEGFRTCTVYMGGGHPWVPGHKVRSLHGPSFRAAIDQARGKGGGEGVDGG